MFDDIIRGLQRIPEQQTISVSVPLDDDGYFDRRCPAEECGAAFKVLFDDWRGKVPDERAGAPSAARPRPWSSTRASRVGDS